MSIIVLGTVALDTVKTPFGKRKHMLGGSAVHFSMSARLFTNVNLVAIIGQDFPQKHIDFLHKKGIILTSLIKEKGSTFKWEGEYKGDLNSALTLNTELGVLSAFRPHVSEQQRDIKYIFLANVDPDVQMHLLKSMRRPHFIGLDSMNFWIKHKRISLLRLLKEVNIYVANDQEARDLSGENNLIKAAKKLSAFGPKMILIKKGEHGVLFYSKGFIFSLPAYATDKVIDPTGAGDTFAGGFMGYLAKIKKINPEAIKRAIVYGTVAASFNVEDFGVDKTSRLTLKDIEKKIRAIQEARSILNIGEFVKFFLPLVGRDREGEMEQKIFNDYKEAMKARDSLKSAVLSCLRAEIMNTALAKKKNKLDDNEVLAVIKKQVKQHQDSIEQFKKGNRNDLVEKEVKELEILQAYLPAQISEEELKKIIDEVIVSTAAVGPKDMGKVMKEVMAKVGSSSDSKMVSDLVKIKLSGVK